MDQCLLPLAECIEIRRLPSVPVQQRDTLPKMEGIYFVLSGDGVVQYIGRSSNLYLRWRTHHRLNLYTKDPCYTIAWLSVSNAELLPAIEKACIDYFKPQDNGARIPRPENDVPRIKQPRFKLELVAVHLPEKMSEEAESLLQGMATRLGIRPREVLELAIRDYAERKGIQ